MEWKNVFFVSGPLGCSGLFTIFVELSPNLHHHFKHLKTKNPFKIADFLHGRSYQADKAYLYTQGFDFINVRLAVEQRKSLT